MVSMVTHNVTLKNGGVPTKSTISRLLLDLDSLTLNQIKTEIQEFNHIVRYAN